MTVAIVVQELRLKLTRKYLEEITILLVLLVLGYIILSKVGLILQTPYIKATIINAGFLSPIVFAILYEISIIIAPLPGFPLVIMGFDIFGIPQTVILNYLLSLIGGVINYYIARRWGRPVVQRLVGVGGLRKIDRHVDEFSTEMLILTRLFDGFLFEWVSYAAGFTTISFGRYFIITAICSIPYNLILLYFALHIPDLGQLFISLSVIYYIIIGLPFVYYICRRLLQKFRK